MGEKQVGAPPQTDGRKTGRDSTRNGWERKGQGHCARRTEGVHATRWRYKSLWSPCLGCHRGRHRSASLCHIPRGSSGTGTRWVLQSLLVTCWIVCKNSISSSSKAFGGTAAAPGRGEKRSEVSPVPTTLWRVPFGPVQGGPCFLSAAPQEGHSTWNARSGVGHSTSLCFPAAEQCR